MRVVSRGRAGPGRIRPAAGAFLAFSLLATSWLVIAAVLPAHAQTADQSNVNTNAATPSSPGIFPTPSATSQTCLFGCTNQSLSCQSTCITTAAGTTVIPSITIVGTTSSPQTCQSNCTRQLQTCQRNCALGP